MTFASRVSETGDTVAVEKNRGREPPTAVARGRAGAGGGSHGRIARDREGETGCQALGWTRTVAMEKGRDLGGGAAFGSRLEHAGGALTIAPAAGARSWPGGGGSCAVSWTSAWVMLDGFGLDWA